jgi:hypothetical protein
VSPLRDAVSFINSDECWRAFGQHLWKARNAEAFRSNEEKVERAGEIVEAGLAGQGTVKAGVNPGDAQIQRRKLAHLVFHECDEGRDDERCATECDGWELIAERLPCPRWHDQEQVTSLDGGAADWFLVGAKARESKNGVQKVGEVCRVGESGHVGAELS